MPTSRIPLNPSITKLPEWQVWAKANSIQYGERDGDLLITDDHFEDFLTFYIEQHYYAAILRIKPHTRCTSTYLREISDRALDEVKHLIKKYEIR
jgi:hypothetical protein